MTPDVESLCQFLRFPSISTDSKYAEDVSACADWLLARLTDMGLSAEKHATARHPVVVARNEHESDRPTVLIYGHYDVQPVDPLDLWDHPPFEPHIENGVIFARGSTDNKGQLLAHLLGVEKTLSNGLPVNLVFLFEGEEEIGSPNLKPFLEEHRSDLACDVIAVSDTGMVAPGVPTFTYGLRGIACVELEVHGPSTDLHSGIYGGAITNPAAVVARLVASLHHSDGKIAIPGFYNDVEDLQDWERTGWAELPYGDKEMKQLCGVDTLTGEPGYTALERVWSRPTAEVNGIGGGYQGEGSKTVIPSTAMCKLSFRLVPHQDPAEIIDQACRHLKAQCPPGVELKISSGHSGRPYLVDPHDAFGKAAQAALKNTFDAPVALIREGGSIPIVDSFKEVLGADTLLLGLALPDCRAHAPNENFHLENFEAGIRLNQELLRQIADT